MFKLTYKLNINDKEFKQTLSITKDTVLIDVNTKQILFTKKHDNCFQVEHLANTLKPIFSENMKEQMESFKTMIGKIECSSIENNYTYKTYKGREIKLSGNGSIKLETKLITAQIHSIESTAYSSYIENEGKNQILQLPLSSNEIIAYCQTEIFMPQGNQKTTIELLNVVEEKINLDQILSYAIIS